jgi:uncharacterized membrane protein
MSSMDERLQCSAKHRRFVQCSILFKLRCAIASSGDEGSKISCVRLCLLLAILSQSLSVLSLTTISFSSRMYGMRMSSSAVQQVRKCSRFSLSFWHSWHTGDICLLYIALWHCRVYVPVRSLALTVALVTSLTHSFVLAHSGWREPILQVSMFKYLRDERFIASSAR